MQTTAAIARLLAPIEGHRRDCVFDIAGAGLPVIGKVGIDRVLPFRRLHAGIFPGLQKLLGSARDRYILADRYIPAVGILGVPCPIRSCLFIVVEEFVPLLNKKQRVIFHSDVIRAQDPSVRFQRLRIPGLGRQRARVRPMDGLGAGRIVVDGATSRLLCDGWGLHGPPYRDSHAERCQISDGATIIR